MNHYCITTTPKTAYQLTKYLKQHNFNISVHSVDQMGVKNYNYYITSNLKSKEKAPPLEIKKLGVYQKTVTFMLLVALSKQEEKRLEDLLISLNIKMISLGMDGGWLGFPYYFVYFPKDLNQIIYNMEEGFLSIDQEFDELSKKYNYSYDKKTRDMAKDQATSLLNYVKKIKEKYEKV